MDARAGMRVRAQPEHVLDLPRGSGKRPVGPAIRASASPRSTMIAPITVVRVRTISRAASGVTPRRPMRAR